MWVMTKLLADMIDDKLKIRRLKRNDIILIAVLLLAAAIGFAYLNFFRAAGNTVTVTVDGQEYGVYSLSQNRVENIFTGDEGLNRLVISNGKAFVETANCPDGICSAHSPIWREGESIVCLPHRVVVSVSTVQTNDGLDIVA